MKYEDLYGWKDGDLRSAQVAVQSALGIEMNLHESLHRGGDYYLGESLNDETFIVQCNEEDWPPEPAEPDFTDYPILLRVEMTTRPCEIARRLKARDPHIKLLRRREVRPPGEYDPGIVFPPDCPDEYGPR